MKRCAVVAALAAFAFAGCTTPLDRGRDSSPPNAANCPSTSEREIAALFDRWNESLRTGDPQQVADNYAEDAILLPTVSDRPRLTREDRVEYFEHFLQDRPFGKIDQRRIYVACNAAVDAGLYTFTFERTGAVVPARYSYSYKWDGKRWLITSHHSSAMPGKP